MTSKMLDPLTVTALSTALKQTVESQFSHVHVKGEISGLKHHSSGHLYFALKDDRSVLDGVCWRGTAQYLKTVPEDGMEVTVTGRLTTYPGRSKYQIVVETLEIAGEGALLKLLEDRRKALAAEGLFEESRKKPIPQFPKVIGVITSPTGAVIRDILHRVKERYPCQVVLWPVAVQGPGAAESIAKAIEGFHQESLPFPKPDLLIVGRGGGSLEDLWAFNEEVVVRATANATLPLISAVGHETDTTLIDFASDWRAPTPTAAAEKATPVRQDILQALHQNQYRGLNALNRRLSHYTTQLEGLIRGLPKPIQLVENAWQRLDDWTERMKRIWGQRFEDQARKVDHLSRLLEGYSYHKTLERGFLIVKTPEGEVLTSAKAICQNQKATLTFADGETPAVLNPSATPVPKKRKPPAPSGKQDTLW